MNVEEAFLQIVSNNYETAKNAYINSTDCFAPSDKPQVKRCPAKSKKGNNPMRYYDEYNDVYVDAPPAQTDDYQKRNYLQGRIYETQSAKNHDLMKTFGLVDDDAPATAKEFIQRIQDGKFVLKKETEDKKTYRPADFITWRDPAVLEDQEGFAAASVKFSVAVTDAVDTAKIAADPADGLKALKALEAWQPTK